MKRPAVLRVTRVQRLGWFADAIIAAIKNSGDLEMEHELPWDNLNVAVVDEQCPIHGDNGDCRCWPCHVAGVLADPESCEPVDAEE